jgi:hypothetical protein
MRTALFAVVLILSWPRETRAQDEFDGYKVKDVTVVGNVLFAFQAKDFEGEPPCDYSLADVVTPQKAEYQGQPDWIADDLIAWTLGISHTFEPYRLTLQGGETGSRFWYWSVSGHLMPFEGMVSGPPWTYRGWVRGDGTWIRPKAYLYDVIGFQGDTCIRCYLDVESLILKPNANVLTGDEIRTKAVEQLTKFMSELSADVVATEESEFDEGPSVWQYHSQELIEDLPGANRFWGPSSRAWSVYFVDGTLIGDGSNSNDLPRFCIWLTEDGQVGKLDLGSDLHYDTPFHD